MLNSDALKQLEHEDKQQLLLIPLDWSQDDEKTVKESIAFVGLPTSQVFGASPLRCSSDFASALAPTVSLADALKVSHTFIMENLALHFASDCTEKQHLQASRK